MEDLVERARRGDQEAFASIANACVDRLFAIARRILQDHGRAEDAVQTALLSAWRDLPSLRDVSRFEPWLQRVLVRACYAEARRQRAFAANVKVISAEPSTPDPSAWMADRDQLDRVFRRLSVEQRAVVVLHFYTGLDLADVAKVLGIPHGTARSRLHYALRTLRAALEDDGARALEGRLA